MFVFKNFEELDNHIKATCPITIYKFRTWEDDFHKRIIMNNEVWFAHPMKLNDPYDVRVPYNFIIKDIDWDYAKMKIESAGRFFNPAISDDELKAQVAERFELLKTNPQKYFANNRRSMIEDASRYDMFGVFSCCQSCENETMWAHYGNNHQGFAVGFNTVELARTLNCVGGFVDYSDEPLNYYPFGNNEGVFERELFRKSTKWQNEEELRFLTLGIGFYSKRAAIFPTSAVTEIVFGLNTNEKTKEEIITNSKVSFPNIEYYQMKTKENAYGFEKVKLDI